MDLHGFKARLQQHLGDGIVTIIGSGLSCAEGLPGMGELAEHLRDMVGIAVTGEDAKLWKETVPLITANGLEAALLQNKPSPTLEAIITAVTARFISEREKLVIQNVFSGGQILRLTRLLKHLVVPDSGLTIITTNYDRLVEIAAEEAGMGVDTMFVGMFAGVLNARESKLSFCRDVTLQKKCPKFSFRKHILVCKPHGSLDWYLRNSTPVHYGGELLDAVRLVITPGQNKFRNGYESPFDKHRDRANRAIDQASGFLVIGYGFNDDHLETHLAPAIRSGKPTLLLTHALSDVARRFAFEHANVMAMEHVDVSGRASTRAIFDTQEHILHGLKYWDLNSFVNEVLEP